MVYLPALEGMIATSLLRASVLDEVSGYEH